MSREPDPKLQAPHYQADEDPPVTPGETATNIAPLPAEANRGRRAPDSGSGVVRGSGAGAGGGAPENYDEDHADGDRSPG